MSRTLIRIQDLWFSFKDTPVLAGVNLTIHSGDFMAILGPNGGGKTTLLKLILGLLKPDQGTVRVFDHPPREVVHRIGYVPQDVGVKTTFPISVLDVVLMGRLRPGIGWSRYSSTDTSAVQDALERMEMWEFRSRRIEQLSGGQRQRVNIARALVDEPEILLLDEPTSSVDTKGQTDLYNLLEKLNETMTILVVSHDISIISSYVKSVACVNHQVFFHDAPEVTADMLEMAYQCPVELIAHGLPHRVLEHHGDD